MRLKRITEWGYEWLPLLAVLAAGLYIVSVLPVPAPGVDDPATAAVVILALIALASFAGILRVGQKLRQHKRKKAPASRG